MTHPGAEALKIWKERLGFLLREQAVGSDPAQKFTLQKQIEEARAAIRELQGEVDPTAGPDFALGRLPVPGRVFVGREPELRRLDTAWAEAGIHVIALVAFGGMGKSALVHRWLDRLAAAGWPGVQRAFDWSFYSQGTGERVTSAELFLAECLRFCGDPDPQAGSPHDRGQRLAGLLRQRPTMLVLDGVEPLQYPPGPLAGKLKDAGLAALLKGLAYNNPGLCVVTTRERIADLNGFAQTAPQVELEELGVADGVELLKRLGVDGREKELRAAVEEFGGHALTLSLLGSYLKRFHKGDVRRRQEVDLSKADEQQGGRAFRVIATYVKALGEGPELAVLRLLGLFDRPADIDALRALRAAPPVRGLTKPLFRRKGLWRKEPISEQEWQDAVAWLQDHGLLESGAAKDGERLDAHPLVRVYFAEELAERRPEAWREGNRRLYEHLCRAAPDLPDTLEEMQPLFAAVVHGCRAGRVQEAYREVYRRRIQRGNEFYSAHKLGALGSELTALAGFFERPWSQPSAELTAAAQAFVLNEAGYRLRALGRLVEAVEPMQASLNACLTLNDWKEAAIRASNLSELTLTLGEVAWAVELGRQSLELADRSGYAFLRMGMRTTWADALYQAGRREESAAAFREAEALQAEWQPEYPRLYSLWGFRYCDLLLGQAEPADGSGLDGLAAAPEAAERFREVAGRGKQLFEWRVPDDPLLDRALDHLTLGHAHHGLSRTAPSEQERDPATAAAAEHLNRAVDGLRQAGQDDYLLRGLLARAAYRRLRRDFAAAEVDLAEVLEIAERGPMRLHECDAHLELFRLRRHQGRIEEAWRHLERARVLVEQTGYLRRAREVEWGFGQLGRPGINARATQGTPDESG
jgi:tetratricopeptide (TPR) repeat protein